MEEVVGKLKVVVFHNEENLYSVIKVKVSEETDSKYVTLTGNFPVPKENVEYRFIGEYLKHPKFGLQFVVSNYQEIFPNSQESIIKYLSSPLFPKIGIKTAKKIYDFLGEECIENIKNNPKWYMGSSDPSSLLHIITTKLDIATIYGFNAASFDHDILHKSELNAIEIMKGNIIPQTSYEKYELEKDETLGTYNLTEDVYWKNLNEEEINIKGRIIGLPP